MPIRISPGFLLLGNELIYYVYKYQKGWFQFPAGLPLQLCDLILWLTVAAMLAKPQFAFEFCVFAGLAGTSMAVLTPDLWEPFPSHPTVYFFLAHCGIVDCILYLWWSGTMRPLAGCVLEAGGGFAVRCSGTVAGLSGGGGGGGVLVIQHTGVAVSSAEGLSQVARTRSS